MSLDPGAVQRARQGAGARYDAAAAPHGDLLLARRGTAYFARLLNALTDPALGEPSRRSDRSRAQVVASVCYQARAMAECVAWLRRGGTGPIPAPDLSADRIEPGANLPPHALRSLFQHTAIHLNVEWRDMTDQDWACEIPLFDQSYRSAALLPSIRASAIWTAALDLNNGARPVDLPEGIAAPDQASNSASQ